MLSSASCQAAALFGNRSFPGHDALRLPRRAASGKRMFGVSRAEVKNPPRSKRRPLRIGSRGAY